MIEHAEAEPLAAAHSSAPGPITPGPRSGPGTEGGWTDLLALISHELRNPMTALSLATHLLEQEARSLNEPSIRELSVTANSLAKRTSVLIDELLDFTRLESGHLVLLRRWASLGPIIDEAMAEVRLYRSNVLIYRETPDRVDVTTYVDPERLRLVIRNLLNNAVQHGRSPICIRLVVTSTDFEIHVEDAGGGVPPEDREAIFERFRRGAGQTSPSGAGIGLFVCRRIVEQHGGTVRAESSLMGGADFVITLPRHPEGSDIPARPATTLDRT